VREALVLLVGFFASIAVTAWILHFDIRRLPPRLQARAWPVSSLWAAVAWFAPLCLLIHFVRTRRSIVGLLLGLAWLAGALVAIEGLAQAADWLIGALEN
jgi:hypothetical protein